MAKELKEENGKFYLDLETDLKKSKSDPDVQLDDYEPLKRELRKKGYSPQWFNDSFVNYFLVSLGSMCLPIGFFYWLILAYQNLTRVNTPYVKKEYERYKKPILIHRLRKSDIRHNRLRYSETFVVEDNRYGTQTVTYNSGEKIPATKWERGLYIGKGLFALFLGVWNTLYWIAVIGGLVTADWSSDKIEDNRNVIFQNDSIITVKNTNTYMYEEPMTEKKMLFPMIRKNDTLIYLNEKVLNTDSTAIWYKVIKKEIYSNDEGWIMNPYPEIYEGAPALKTRKTDSIPPVTETK